MVGLTYTAFKPQDFCYIVVAAVDRPEWEFLEAIVQSITPGSAQIPAPHPLWNYLQQPPAKVQVIRAKVIDPKVRERNPKDPIKLNQEPGRHYLVVHPRERVRYLEYMLAQQ